MQSPIPWLTDHKRPSSAQVRGLNPRILLRRSGQESAAGQERALRRLAVGDPQAGARLLAGIVYQPYYLGTFALAAFIVWRAPQTWDWTRTLTQAKAAAVLALLLLSATMLTTQAFNPFIYFIF
jgi:hypothetical protein